MVKNLIRCLLLVLTCLGGILGLETKVRVQTAAPLSISGEVTPSRPIGQDRLWAEEPSSSPLSAITRRTLPSHRVVSTRSSRLLPTQGGKSGHPSSRLASGQWSNLLNYLPQLQRCCLPALRGAATSPRLRYIIALRRLLC